MHSDADYEKLQQELIETRRSLTETLQQCLFLRQENARLIKEFREFIEEAYKTVNMAKAPQQAKKNNPYLFRLD